MQIQVRPFVAAAVLLVVLLAVSGASFATGELTVDDDEPAVDRVELDDGTELWPYTSRAADFDTRTLALNVVVYGNESATERLLRMDQLTEGEWRDLEEDEHDVRPQDRDVNITGAALDQADGAVRYTNVVLPDGTEHWLTESYQLKDGTYLGERTHIRAYQSPGEAEITAFQAHDEHWDWFQLRHNVHSIETAQQTVELEFIDHPLTESLVRERFGNDHGSDSDGWVTVVDLDDDSAPLLLGVGVIGSVAVVGRRLQQDDHVQTAVRAALTVGSIIAVYGFVRLGAIQAELLFPAIHVKVIAAIFYPILAIGIPICAYLGARKLTRTHAFATAATGFGLALLAEYTYLGVNTLPLDTLIQHASLAIAVGFIAAGASLTARDTEHTTGYVRTGVLLWSVALVLALLQYIPFV